MADVFNFPYSIGCNVQGCELFLRGGGSVRTLRANFVVNVRFVEKVNVGQ